MISKSENYIYEFLIDLPNISNPGFGRIIILSEHK
jgi:hypothetical protein